MRRSRWFGATALVVSLAGLNGAPAAGAAPAPVFNGKIAFSFIAGGTRSIYTVDADGLGLTPIPGTDRGRGPTWSRDGSKLAFWVLGGIRIVDADGSNPVTIAGQGLCMEWSPDGTLLALDNYTDIFTIHADGTGLQNLTNEDLGSHGSDWCPSWSPDGMTIAFAHSRTPAAGINVMNADGSGRQVVIAATDTMSGISMPDFSPDGTRIAFWAAEGPQGRHAYVANANGTGVTMVGDPAFDMAGPRWSPDGMQLALIDFTGCCADDFGHIAVMDADGANLRRLPGSLVTDYPVAWQPISQLRSVYKPLVPARILDTRASQRVGADQAINVPVVGVGGVPASGVAAVVLNVTATNPTSQGYLTVSPAGAPRPGTSSLNFAAGATVANLVVAGVGDDGKVSIYNPAGLTDVIVDVEGYFPAGSGLTPLPPVRIFDARGSQRVGAGQSINVAVLGAGGVPASNVGAVIVNVTATNPTAGGYFTAWPGGTARPTASNLNFVSGQTVANLVLAKPGVDGTVSLFNAAGTTDAIFDVVGYISADSAYGSMSPSRVFDSRATLALGPGETRTVSVTGIGGVPSMAVGNVGAVVVNVTATDATTGGYLTVWPTGAARPTASNVNFTPHHSVPNTVITKVGPTGQISIYNPTGTTQVILDVSGWFPVA